MREVIAKCRAKVNLTLDILNKRPDGFHNLESVMQSVDIWDVVRVRETDRPLVEVMANVPGVPSGPGNTVYLACDLFRKAAGINAGITASVEKHVPSQAGLGGGSSDAAGALLALNQLFGQPLAMSQLSDLAAQVGSDVPFFLAGGTALVTGRGEHVEKLPDAPRLDLVIVKPDFGVPTAFAYRKLAAIKGRRSAARTAALVATVRTGDRTGVISNLSNDFDLVVDVEFPRIAEIRNRMSELGAEASLLSGSGAAVFGVFQGANEAAHACEALKSVYPFVTAAVTTPTAIEIEEN